MNELQTPEITCGKATMYVISEEGLEVGPFVYGRKTENRVLCTSTGHMYYRRGLEKTPQTSSTAKTQPGSDVKETRKLRIIDLSYALSSETVNPSRIRRRAMREMENCGLVVGNFRVGNALRKGKQRKSKSYRGVRESDAKQSKHSEIIEKFSAALKPEKLSKKELLSREGDQTQNCNDFCVANFRGSKVREQSVGLQTKLDPLTLEINRLRERRLHLKSEEEKLSNLEKVQCEFKYFKRIFNPSVQSANSIDRSKSLPQLTLPTMTHPPERNWSEKSKKKNIWLSHKEVEQTKQLEKQVSKDSLIFLRPQTQYCHTQAEHTAKLNININRDISTSQPKVRLPVVIDQRTGVMHCVPGAVALQLYDYNQWSRKQNIIRRNYLKSLSPSRTFVSVLPSIAETQKTLRD